MYKRQLKVGIYAVDGNGKTGSLPATFEDFTVNGNVGSFAEEPTVEESTSFMVNYGTNVELTLNGEEQTIANLIGRYTGNCEEGTELNRSFVPSVEGREFKMCIRDRSYAGRSWRLLRSC